MNIYQEYSFFDIVPELRLNVSQDAETEFHILENDVKSNSINMNKMNTVNILFTQ